MLQVDAIDKGTIIEIGAVKIVNSDENGIRLVIAGEDVEGVVEDYESICTHTVTQARIRGDKLEVTRYTHYGDDTADHTTVRFYDVATGKLTGYRVSTDHEGGEPDSIIREIDVFDAEGNRISHERRVI